MSFCSYEEAWGAPYNSNQKNDHVINNNEIIHEKVKNEVLNKHNDVQDDEGMVEVAPLRGSLLGGAIPEEQWKTNEVEDSSGDIQTYGSPKYISTLESNFDKKIDQLINKLEKFSQKCSQPNRESQQTTWTDVIIFISLGMICFLSLENGLLHLNYQLFHNLQEHHHKCHHLICHSHKCLLEHLYLNHQDTTHTLPCKI